MERMNGWMTYTVLISSTHFCPCLQTYEELRPSQAFRGGGLGGGDGVLTGAKCVELILMFVFSFVFNIFFRRVKNKYSVNTKVILLFPL